MDGDNPNGHYTRTTDTMDQLTSKSPPPVEAVHAELQQNDATIGLANQVNGQDEEDRESVESIGRYEASVILAQQPQTSHFSIMSPSNGDDMVDSLEPTTKRLRITSPDISLDRSEPGKSGNSNFTKEATKKRRNAATDDGEEDYSVYDEMASQRRRRTNRIVSDDEIGTTAPEQRRSFFRGTSHQVDNAEEGIIPHLIEQPVNEPDNLSSLDTGQPLIHKTDSHSASVNGEPGHIQQITLQNFMCHEHFAVTFGPRINFIIGSNGSGKSAILAAILIGLGARSSTTNRASGLSSFIKTGQTRAQIVIKLCNYVDNRSQAEAYLPQKYGNSITIERVIYASGAGNYKIKNSSGKVVSEKKGEVDNIIKHFQIMLDNPVCVLTQEVSKNFLNSKNPADMYKFFVKATHLEDVERDYDNAKKNRDTSKEVLSEKNETIEVYQKRLKEAERKVSAIEVVENSVKKMENLSFELLWAEVRDKEAAVNKLTKEFADADKRVRRLEEKVQQAIREKEELEQMKQESMGHLQNLSANVEACKQDLENTIEKADEAERNLSAKVRDTGRCKATVDECKMNIATLEKRIRNIEMKNMQTADTNFEAQIEEVTGQIEELNARQVTYQEMLNQLNSEIEELQGRREQAEEEHRRLTAQAKSSKTELERMGQIQKNRLARYSPGDYGQIIKSIDEATRTGQFQKRPFGPIGEYIHLEDQSIAVAVETLLKKNLRAFIVDNFNDCKVLQSIFSNVIGPNRAQHPDVIIRKYAPLHNVTGHETVLDGYQNFLQILNIKEPEVANCLIDHCSIEKILYIPDYQVAQDMLIDSDTVPRNCFKAYTAEGDVMFPASDRSDYKCYPNKGPKVARVIVKDFQLALEEHRKNVDDFSRDALTAEDKKHEITKLFMAKKRELVETEKSLGTVDEEISQLERKLDSLKGKAKVKPVEVIALKEEIHRFSQDRDTEQKKLDELMIERDQLRDVFAAIDTMQKEKATKYHEMIETRNPTKEKIEKLELEIATKNGLLMNLNKKQTEMGAKRDQLEEKLAEQKQQVDLAREQALANTPEEIGSPRSYSEVTVEINQTKLIISENRHMAENSEQIVGEFKRLQILLDRLVEERAAINGYIDLLSKSIEERKTVYRRLRVWITRVINYFFHDVLASKEFTGSITPYFHETTDGDGNVKKGKTLEVSIYPRSKEQPGGNTSNTKSLSGGERSFSTVAFIVALWEICHSPFRLLDEVDVFMDMVTRKESIETLIFFATERSNKQFIFLSPLQMQQIARPEYVTIHNMPEPARN